MRQRERGDVPLVGTSRPMAGGANISTRGVLRPLAGFEYFELSREAAPSDIAPLASFFWTVRWDVPPGESYEQAVLPFPCVNLALEDGVYRVHGPGSARFVARLTGRGWVTGLRFTPAGFSSLSRWPMRDLLDRVALARDVVGNDPDAASTPELARERMTTFVRRHARPDPMISRVDRLVTLAETNPSIVSVEALAREAGTSVRSLHRLFARYVGVSTKWVVRRARVQDAAERVARGAHVDWAAVAHELGYHDQSHLIRDFRAQIGQPPTAYAKSCIQTGATTRTSAPISPSKATS